MEEITWNRRWPTKYQTRQTFFVSLSLSLSLSQRNLPEIVFRQFSSSSSGFPRKFSRVSNAIISELWFVW
ncbi:hypothetical protein Bca4012_082099 [Brassica carinata]